MKLYSLLCFFVAVTFCSCVVERPTYYVSPLNGNNTAYHAMPLKTDSVHKATYASGSLYFGSANTNQTDKVFNFKGAIYQARQFGLFEAYYGANAAIGNYKVATFDTASFNTSADWKTSNAMAGNKLYTAVGLVGGINIVHVTRHGEWRILGTELSINQEMGSYLNFRQKLPADAANLIIRSANFSTVGLTTETVRKTAQGTYSLKFAEGLALGKAYTDAQALDFFRKARNILGMVILRSLFNILTKNGRATSQATGGAYASGLQAGAIYRLR